MTLEQLRIFVAVAEREHVTRAAEALNLTQSTISAAVSALEARHDVALFDRVGRGIRLTEAGAVFLDEARAVLARAGAAEEALADLAGLKRGTLKLAASQTVANYWLPQRLCRFRAAYPRIDIGLTIGNTEQVRGWVLEGRAALGFVEGPVADPRLLPERVGEDRLVLVMAPDHPLTRMPTVDAAALMSLTFVTREPGSGTRVMLDRLAASAGLALADLQIALELPSNEAVRAAVEAGAGAAVLSRLVADAAIRLGTLAAIDLPLAPRPFFLLRHGTRRPSHTVRAFMEGIDAPLP